ncbi:MAG: NAD-dependent epimerase/dehydratase family protein [Methanolinea sp.]|jgi:GDP-L-fucose synthase|nr:NAD-dependent epimerase/dehydratase family protein [Methanolinea sp.]
MGFWEGKNILITGGAGFPGSAIVEQLQKRGVEREQLSIPRSRDLDLRKWENCQKAVEGKDIVIHLAAKVGGIGFNQKYPADLFFDNAIMGIQIIEAARQAGVGKCVVLGTVCAYPKFTPVPFREENLWNGYPEETNAPYGLFWDPTRPDRQPRRGLDVSRAEREFGFRAEVPFEEGLKRTIEWYQETLGKNGTGEPDHC